MCLGLDVYFRAPGPGVFLFFLGTACFLGAFFAVFFGVLPVSSCDIPGTSSIWTVSVSMVEVSGHAPEVSLFMGSSSPSNRLRLTNCGPGSTMDVSRGSSDCLTLDGSGWTSTVAAVSSFALTAVAAGGFLLRSAWVF